LGGIGVALLGALLWRDALVVALLGGATGAVVHFVSHLLDRHLGGRSSDPLTLGILAAILLIALAMRLRQLKQSMSAGGPERPASPARSSQRD
jgi:hypothetical protein